MRDREKVICGAIEVILGDWEEALSRTKNGILSSIKMTSFFSVLKNPKEIAQGQSKSEGNTPRGRTKGSQRKKKGQVKPLRTLERPSEAGIPPFQVRNAFKKNIIQPPGKRLHQKRESQLIRRFLAHGRH